MKKTKLTIALLLPLFIFQYCSKKSNSVSAAAEQTAPILPTTAYNYLIAYPAHIQNDLTSNDNTPADNPITNDGATLGRVLFYDKQLSKNNTISCGSCHKQDQAFDDNAALSKGFEGGLTTRNSMAILNLRFYKNGKMFWDERAATLEKQVLQPIQNHIEMGLTLNELETKVKSLSYYPALFQKAFGSTQIDSVRIAKSLSQFCRSIVTYQAKYDRVKQGQEQFSPAEAAGEQLFLNAGNVTCASCHKPPMFLTSTPAQGFGLADNSDLGINNQRRFKSGSLRNISNRSSLFHNGSIANVQAMLNAGAPGSNLPAIAQHSVAPQDVQNIIAFINTLTDNTIISEARFSNPFQNK